jgi:hypothetical protein
MNDVLFTGLLVVSVTMMVAGLASNLYLIWSVQRGQTEAMKSAQEITQQARAIDALERQKQPNPPVI